MTDNECTTWLDKLDERMNIDIDWMDPGYIGSLPKKPYDQTSNQLWLGIQLTHESNEELLKATAKELKSEGWLVIYTRMATLLCQKNLDLIQGRVLVQTLPSQAYNMERTLEHARLYDREFQRLGIPRTRFAIKIISTGPGVNAARILQQEGISTLGTAVFSVQQAIACSQANCLYISPYYNEVRSHTDPSLWPDVEDPATQHPFSNRIVQMLEAFKQLYEATGQDQPLIKNCAFRSLKEVIATAEFGCHSATVSPTMFDELSSTSYDKSLDIGAVTLKAKREGSRASAVSTPTRLQHLLQSDPLTGNGFTQVSTKVDYLASNGAALEMALSADPAGSTRLNDAIALFISAENASKEHIEGLMSSSVL
ncbi:hypothetical protein VTL71DRAFT_16533 [Oculimacula yallundae]|uniref:Transaldolase n=1 Tax=Oculimacula yallundae TaxID=86028 RepID=A0ABR4CEQ3_9HELO